MAKTFKFGITGGIGCGKTYACGLFKKLGVEVYNTDEHEVAYFGGASVRLTE
jgi:dephospho-CoA kinase